jgi:hypothetical protein
MKRPATIAILVVAAAGGFAAGWFPVAQKAAPGGHTSRRTTAAPTQAPPVEEAAAFIPKLPALDTVESCRLFLERADGHYATRHPFARRAIRDYALRRWLELDAESALTEAERQPGNEFSVDGFGPDLFRVWLDLHPGSAISAWNQASPILARNVRLSFLTALADKDPAMAFAVSQTPRGKGGKFGDAAEEAIFRRWAQLDLRTARARAQTPTAAAAVFDEWALTSPGDALAHLRSSAGPDDPGWRNPALFPVLLRTDPALAQKVIAAASGYGLQGIAHQWVERDTGEAMRWAQSQPADSPLAAAMTGEIVRKITYSDPLRAVQLMQEAAARAPGKNGQAGDQTKEYVLREAVASLAATDLAGARDWLGANPELAKSGGMAGFFTYAFASDPAAAIAQYQTWAENPALKEAAMAGALMAFRWDHGAGARDPSQLIAAVPELADKVDGDVLSGWAKANPTGAADFILQRVAAGKSIGKLDEKGVLAELAISQPRYTSLWLQRLPDPGLQQQTAHTLAANWSVFDPEAAAEWINKLPDGPVREAALAGYDHRLKEKRSLLEEE